MRPLRSLILPLTLAAVATALPGVASLSGLPALPTASADPPHLASLLRPLPRDVAFRQWTTGPRTGLTDATADLATHGRSTRTEVRGGAVKIGTNAAGERALTGRWSSPWVRPGFSLTELVPSWEAATPGASSIEVEVRGRSTDGVSSWDTIAVWAKGDEHVRRSSGASQTDDLGRVLYDTWLVPGASAWQVRVVLRRPTPEAASPRVETVGAMVSRLPSVARVTTSLAGSHRGEALGTVLPVPRYSQMVHRGSYRQYGGGGEAWCSPTSTAMVLAYYDALPPESSYSWVRRTHPDPEVVQLARATYDTSYGGTGTWPFNTAYAASRTDSAFVTRLRNLREVERFVNVGIPLVASIRFGAGELRGAPISSSNGHLLVIAGFTRGGDVVVNDPAADTRAGVRRVYDRTQFESAWLRRDSSGSGGSGGIVYVVHDEEHPLPENMVRSNW